MITPGQILDSISKQSQTYYQLVRRVRTIKENLEKKLYGKTIQQEEVSGDDQQWLNSLDESFWGNFSRENFSQVFESVDQDILKIIPLVIYTAFEVSPNQIKELSGFIKEKFGENMLIELRYDPTLIAGCALVWKGNYKDYSLRSRIEESKREVFSTFKSYIK